MLVSGYVGVLLDCSHFFKDLPIHPLRPEEIVVCPRVKPAPWLSKGLKILHF